MSQQMINGNHPTEAGFGMLPIIVDTHMSDTDRASRELRLLNAVRNNPKHIGIGLDEATAAIIQNGEITRYGKGRVLIAHHEDLSEKIGAIATQTVEIATLRDCSTFDDKNIKAYCYENEHRFPLGQYNRIPQPEPISAIASLNRRQ